MCVSMLRTGEPYFLRHPSKKSGYIIPKIQSAPLTLKTRIKIEESSRAHAPNVCMCEQKNNGVGGQQSLISGRSRKLTLVRDEV